MVVLSASVAGLCISQLQFQLRPASTPSPPSPAPCQSRGWGFDTQVVSYKTWRISEVMIISLLQIVLPSKGEQKFSTIFKVCFLHFQYFLTLKNQNFKANIKIRSFDCILQQAAFDSFFMVLKCRVLAILKVCKFKMKNHNVYNLKRLRISHVRPQF